ncbi:MAG TPA: hypothetical protein VN711_00810 [Candidatus Saccharimonadales bacterium]|nr:hypothetical protein [Candidatus Saccharimonadales bacterium]
MGHKKTIVFFLIWPIFAFWFSRQFAINALFSSILFYGIPSLLLSLQKPSVVKKSFIVSLFIIPFMIIVDYVAELTKTWVWPLPQSILPLKLFHVVSLEVIIWAFLHTYIVILFYQYFFEKSIIKKFWNGKSREAFIGTTFIFIIFLFILYLSPIFLYIPYWYFVFGILGILPVVLLEEIRYPQVFPKLLKTAMYFFYLNFTYEITALKIGWWSFPSTQFIGHVSFFGVIFPFEEFFFWILLFTLAILSYYEYFFNRER